MMRAIASSSICPVADPRIPSGPAAVSPREGRIHDRKTRLHRSVIVLANRGWSIHVILLEQDGADQSDDAGVIGEDADDIGASFDFFIEALFCSNSTSAILSSVIGSSVARG